MKPDNWQQLDDVFHSALNRALADRAKFLDEAGADKPSVRKQVEALLSAHEEAASFIEHPALEVEARSLASEKRESVVSTDGKRKALARGTLSHHVVLIKDFRRPQ